MSFSLKQISLILLLFFISNWPCAADDQKREDTIKVITDYAYRMGDKDSKEKSRALALFGAKLKAVNLAAKYLTHKGVLEHYGKKQSEIFYLTTNEIKVSIIDEKSYQDINSYYFKIESEVTSIDFIRAEIKDFELEKIESSFSYSKEMEQPVSKIINPGEELSRASRYIRKEQWRISIIYLDHLQKKYPHWGDVFLAKAIAFYGMDDIDKMIDALKTACSLNNQEACNELQSFSSNSFCIGINRRTIHDMNSTPQPACEFSGVENKENDFPFFNARIGGCQRIMPQTIPTMRFVATLIPCPL